MYKQWLETILKEYPRLSPESKFHFSCHKGLSCFTKCCADVNIFLTPYDVLRMKKTLGLSSGDFLEEYTIAPFMADHKLPLVMLKMKDDAARSCPFVAPAGCRIYEDRPWACRMFPLGVASAKTTDRPEGPEFCFIADDKTFCQGIKENREWTVAAWWQDQGIAEYDRKSQAYRDITLHRTFREGKQLGPAKIQMFYIACYDIDRFRQLLFQNDSFFSRFNIGKELGEQIQADDEALLNFAYDWLKFSLFGESTVKIKNKVLRDKKRELAKLSNSRGTL